MEERRIRSRFSLPTTGVSSLFKPSTSSDSAKSAPAAVNRVGSQDANEAEFRLNINKTNEGTMESGTWERVSKDAATNDALRSENASGGSFPLRRTLARAAEKAAENRSVPKDFVFKDFLPKVFAEVRAICKIDPTEYAEAFLHTTQEKFSEGRSGAFLYFSSNLKYIVKTTTEAESIALRNIMENYVEYIKVNPNSLIVRFLGAHSLTLYGRRLFFVVMLNVFAGAEFSERYDLKGSWVQRHGDNKRFRRGTLSSKSTPLYKDSDLQFQISLPPQVSKKVAEQIRKDTLFLRGIF